MGALTPLGSPRLAPAPSGPRASLPPPQAPAPRSRPLRPPRLAPAPSGPRPSLPPPQAPAPRSRPLRPARLAPALSGPRGSLPPPQAPEARSRPLRPPRLAPAPSGPRATPARAGPARPRGAASEAAEGSAGVPRCRARRGEYLGALVEVVHGPRAHEGELRVRVDAAGQDQLAGGVWDPQPGRRVPGRQQVAPQRPHHAVLHQHVGHLRGVVVDHAPTAYQEPRRRRHGEGRTRCGAALLPAARGGRAGPAPGLSRTRCEGVGEERLHPRGAGPARKAGAGAEVSGVLT